MAEARNIITGDELRPGDLRIVQDPTGVWRICEAAGHYEFAGFGDVVFRIGDERWCYMQEGRSPAIDGLIGKPFKDPREVRAAMIAADAAAFARHKASVSRFEVKQ